MSDRGGGVGTAGLGATERDLEIASGRYVIHFQGRECGEERWSISRGGPGLVVVGEQQTLAPHPFPSRQAWRATLTPEWRVTGIEILWKVGDHELRAIHSAEGGRWRARIEHQGRTREQEGDFPQVCEVDYGTHLFSAFILARRDFAIGGEHDFPVLRIGPPWMAVDPERMSIRCVEAGTIETPFGAVPAKRYRVAIGAREEEGYDMWADERGVVLQSREGTSPGWPWMTLVEYRWT